MRNYKALEGVVKALRWTLWDKDIEHPLEWLEWIRKQNKNY